MFILKKLFLKISQYPQKMCLESLFKAFNFIKKTPTQVFSCECYEILKNTYSEEQLRTATSEDNEKEHWSTKGQSMKI